MDTTQDVTPGLSEADRHLRVRRLGIDTFQEPVVMLRSDSHVCRAEGFESQSRVEIRHGERRLIATLNVVRSGGAMTLAKGEAGLSEEAWRELDVAEGDHVTISHPAPVESFAQVRAKIFGHPYSSTALAAIIGDIVGGRYSHAEMAAFVTACAGNHLDLRETVALTRAMIDAGTCLRWASAPVMDKHCVGGLPGNRTTLIVVPIVAALGVTIPKTSSRAITSPAGTADTMETLAPVNLDIAAMRRVVESEGGCIVWGGAMNLSPADDMLIRVEQPLDLDGEAQLVASVISKKVAAGSTHALIDVPTGATAKVRTPQAAAKLSARLIEVGQAFGLEVDVVLTDGSQPVGCGIGPALEARDVLAVLRGDTNAPADLRERSLLLAGRLLELAGRAPRGDGLALARSALEDGRAWRKFQAIATAQGGLHEPRVARLRHIIAATTGGVVRAIDNRRLARIAKLAGAPHAPESGVDLHVHVGTHLERGQPMYTVHADSAGELEYALEHARTQNNVIAVEAP